MYNELMELGDRLEQQGKLVPFGFYRYSTPIRWIIHLWSDNSLKYHIEESDDLLIPRPNCGRTSGTGQAHPIADEAGYVFGIKSAKTDKKAKKKQEAYHSVLKKIQKSNLIASPELKQAVSTISDFLKVDKIKNDPDYQKMNAKDWVSFVIEDSFFADPHIFQHEELKCFWAEELSKIKSQKIGKKMIEGECSICGEKTFLAVNIPPIKLYKPIPLHSYNKSSFISYFEGANPSKKCHLGQCFKCATKVASTLNYLRENPLNHKVIMEDKKDGKLNVESPRNQFAFFWLKNDLPLKTKKRVINPNELIQNLTATMGNKSAVKTEVITPDINHVKNLLNIPWTSENSALNVAQNEFYILVLSPNKARIIVRDWIQVSLENLKNNLKIFLDKQNIIDPLGKEYNSFALPDILKAIESSNLSKPDYKTAQHPNPNLMRQLLRTAYVGTPPPSGLLELAVSCFRNPKIFEKTDTMHIVAAVLKMMLTYDKEESMELEKLDPKRDIPAYLCGRLLAVLEEAQLKASGWKINSTLVDRFYGSASSSPASILGVLVTRATTDHFPKIRKKNFGYKKLEEHLENVMSAIHEKGGFPSTLSLKGQAEFSLGFYHQRAKYQSERKNKKSKIEQDNDKVKGKE